MKESGCPDCGKTLDMATSTDGTDTKPQPDDFTLCIYCGSINKFGEDMGLLKVTPIELSKLKFSEPELLKHLLDVSNHIKKRAN